uniref:DEAD-box ATP-dependent RNA helicase 32 n=1 Tax=Anthurium amnicola TaxID=1678845 RepID=A0A1D1YXK1_9ARAE
MFTANMERLRSISGDLASLLVKYPSLQALAQRAFITYLRSIHLQRDKEVFDVSKLPFEEFAASLGLPMTPVIRFLQKLKGKVTSKNAGDNRDNDLQDKPMTDFRTDNDMLKAIPKRIQGEVELQEESENDILSQKEAPKDSGYDHFAIVPCRVLKKKKLKINMHRPIGTRVVFDDEGNTLPPLASLAETNGGDGTFHFSNDEVENRFKKLKEQMKKRDKEDKLVQKQSLRERRTKEKMKIKKQREQEADDEDDLSGSDGAGRHVDTKRQKIYFDSDSDEGGKEREGLDFAGAMSVAAQEDLALEMLNRMHSNSIN